MDKSTHSRCDSSSPFHAKRALVGPMATTSTSVSAVRSTSLPPVSRSRPSFFRRRIGILGQSSAEADILDARSEKSLKGVHADLVRVVRAAAKISTIDFVVTEGLRTIERQRSLVASGASTTMKSRHITGHAVDLAARVNGEIRWDWPLYQKLAAAMKAGAAQVGVSIEWGGDWRTFKDGPHFQLPRAKYP